MSGPLGGDFFDSLYVVMIMVIRFWCYCR